MLETTKLPEEFITGIGKSHYGPRVEKCVIEGIDEIQYLDITPKTAIKKHTHDNQWEIWIRLLDCSAYVCMKGEEHELINNTSMLMVIMAIKGHSDYDYHYLASILYAWGFSVEHGSLIANE